MNTKFLLYIFERLGMAVLTMFLVIAITFFVMHAIPASPFNAEKALSDETIAALEAKYGFDKPVPVQFLNYLANILRGDFGLSTKWVGSTVSARPPCPANRLSTCSGAGRKRFCSARAARMRPLVAQA